MTDRRPRGGVGSLFLIDANNFMFRAYHGLPMLTSPDGTPVNAVYGYIRMIMALRKDFAPQHMLAVFDVPGPGFRNELYPAYKANRPPAPEDLRPQLPLVRKATEALSVPWTEVRGFEADDVIAAYAEAAQAAGLEAIVVSSDKDLMQLVDDGGEGKPPIRMWDTMKLKLVGPEMVREKFGVGPERLGDLLALAGDSSDNVPGVPGIGPKTAATLLNEYGDLDTLLARASEIKQKKRRERLIEHAEDARVSRELVALRRDAPLPVPISELEDPGSNRDKMDAFFGPLGFKTTLTGGVGTQGSGGARSGRRSFSAPGVELGDLLSPMTGAKVDRAGYRSFRAADLDALRTWLATAQKAGRFAFQLALTEEDAMRAAIVGIALATEGEPPVYVPTGHRSLTDPPGSQLKLEVVLDLLRPLLEDASCEKLAHAHKSQAVALARAGVQLRGVSVDPMLASYTLDPARSSHAIEDLAKDLMGHKAITTVSVVGKGKKQVPFDQVGVEVAEPFVCERSDLAHQLGTHLVGLVDRAGADSKKLFHDVEMPLAAVLTQLELRGVLLDVDVFAAQSRELGARLDELREAIQAEAGYPVNPESPTQLQKLLFEDRGHTPEKKTKTGYSTDAQVLEKLSLVDPIVKSILEHRSLNKLKGTYLDTFPTLVHPQTGRLHSHFRQAVAQTGRLSSSDPNLQNIPVRTEQGLRIREGFVAPEGMRLVTLDYSQIELRVLAHLSGDPNLSSAFVDGADVHRRTAAEIFEVAEADVTAEERRVAKAVNFGVIYGQQAFGLSRALGIPQGRAGRYIKSYFKKIPGVAEYMGELIERARREGYAETILGRRRRIPELARRGAARSYGERIARNTPIQGSAADILKVAMVEVERLLEDKPWARMLLTVHDELIFECDEARTGELVDLVRPAMEEAAKLSVPLVVDSGSGKTWAEAKG